MFRWISSAIHGGPRSIFEVIEKDQGIHAKKQPESNPNSQILSAAAILVETIKNLSLDANVFIEFSNSVEDLKKKILIIAQQNTIADPVNAGGVTGYFIGRAR